MPKSNSKAKERNGEKYAEKNAFVPKNWMDSDNTFSTSANYSNEDYINGGNNGNDGNSFYSYQAGGETAVTTKKDHNKVRKEKREKKALENPKNSKNAQNVQFLDNEEEAHYETSSSSLKNLLYRAHNSGVSTNRTDSIDMRNNKGKLGERAYAHNNGKNSFPFSNNSHGRYTGNHGNDYSQGYGREDGNDGGNNDEAVAASLLTTIRK